MAMRFRKSINLGGGARINLSKSGIGASFGGKGMRYSVNSKGRRTTTVGIPGSGLSWSSSSKTGGNRSSTVARNAIGLTPYQEALRSDRHAKKVQLAEERRGSALNKLNELYSAGKMDRSVYKNLVTRDLDITIDLMIFGKGAGKKLAERYITGKISDDEFEKLKGEIISEPESEKDSILESFKSQVKDLNDFVSKVRSNKSDLQCNNCKKPKKLFSPLYSFYDFRLCGECKKKFNSLSIYSGYSGRYYNSESQNINPDGNISISLNILSEHILSYR